MSSPEFGEIVDSEFEQLLELYRDLQPEDPVVTDGSDRRAFHTIISSDHLFLLGARIEAQLVASTYLNIIPNITRSASPYAVIENVVTRRDLQNQGIGKQLMAYTLEFAWSRGCYKAMLLTGSRRESTHAFYRSCGFDEHAKFGYVAYPSDV